MADLKFVFVFACVFAIAGLSQVEAFSKREVEQTEQQQPSELEKVQSQLTNAFDSFKKSMEELTSKFNTEDIVQGIQKFTSNIDDYIKQTANQFASTASGTSTKVGEVDPQQPAQPAGQ